MESPSSRPAPRAPRGLVLAGTVVAVAVVAAVLLWLGRTREVPLPEDREQVAPSAEFVDAEAAVEYYRAWSRREPRALEPRVRLAQVLMQLARESGRGPEYIPEAEASLRRALAIDPEHYYALTLQATLLNVLHRFEDARDLSRQLIARYPHHAYTHGTLVDALVELGEYDEAVETLDRMMAIRPSLSAYARVSYLRELHGDTEGAIEAMRAAADAEPGGRLGRAWALHELATLYLGQARPDTAAFLYTGILEERPGFTAAEVGLAHVALVRGDAAEAVRRLEDVRRRGSTEAADELLVEAYTVLGDEARAAEAAGRVHAALRAARAMGENVDMEEADFLADQGRDLDRALQMAAEQVRRRPGHLHANETYAWVLHKKGRSAEGIPFIERAMRLNTGDAMVHHRAGHIYRSAGRLREAAEQFRLSLAGNVHVESPSAATEARALLASLGTPVGTASASR